MSAQEKRIDELQAENAKLRTALQRVRELIPQRMGAEAIREHLQSIVRNIPRQEQHNG